MFAVHKIKIPTVREYLAAKIEVEDPHFSYKLTALSIGVPYEEFLEWGIDEALPVIVKVTEMIEVGFSKKMKVKND